MGRTKAWDLQGVGGEEPLEEQQGMLRTHMIGFTTMAGLRFKTAGCNVFVDCEISKGGQTNTLNMEN